LKNFYYLINVDPFGSVVKHSGIFILPIPAKVVGAGWEGWRGSFFLSLENWIKLMTFLISDGEPKLFITDMDPDMTFQGAPVPDPYGVLD
jgi:hypothetical protein